ncbi:DNA glycosylase [Mycena capillaripes]|nr:DNA glycosylase [Mycena capillaripes]
MPKTLKSTRPTSSRGVAQADSSRIKEQRFSTTSETPFPRLLRPTPTETREFYALICDAQGTPRTPESTISNSLESLISIILSQSTSGANSARVKANLDATFGRKIFAAIADASREQVVEAIRCGGLAAKNAATVQTLLAAVQERHGAYSLQFLGATTDAERMTDGEVTRELLSYKGVGPKTAACVLSLWFGRQAFAVDTLAWRLSKMLGWVPECADRVREQAHLEQRVPVDLKHGLHALLMHHGRTCSGCKKDGKGPCVLKNYLRERVGGS